MKYGFLFSVPQVVSGPNPGNISMKAIAQIEGGLVEAGVGRRCPEVKLVTRRAALETLVGVFRQIHGKTGAFR